MISNKYRPMMVIIVLLVSIVFLSGCSGNKSFVLKDAKSIGPLKVVNYEAHPLEIYSRAESLAINVGMVFAIPTILKVREKAKAFRESANLTDYTVLVMQGFVKRIKEEIPDWPQMQVENNPVKDTYKYDGGALLAFSIDESYILFELDKGLWAKTVATMTDRNGDIIWKKQFNYTTREYNKNYPMPTLGYDADIYTADNGKLLKEEMNYAANMTINDLIKHFKEK